MATESAVAQPGAGGKLPFELAGFQVLIDTLSIPLLSVRPREILAAVPYDLPLGAVT